MRIAQSEKYEGNDWWTWSVWIEGTAEELRSIEQVTYTLHPTYSNPVRKVTERRSKFKLTESGWGTFIIYARVDVKNGRPRNLKHELALYYPEAAEADSVAIRINDDLQEEPGRQIEALHLAIKDAAPDATIEREAAPKRGESAAPLLNVVLAAPALFSIAKGIQGWLSKNPQATVDLLK